MNSTGGTVSGLVTNNGTMNAGGGALNGGLANGGTINAAGAETTIADAYTNAAGGIANTGNTTSALDFGGDSTTTGSIAGGTGSTTIQAGSINVNAGRCEWAVGRR